MIIANALAVPLADSLVHCVVTSPPFWNLRDYGVDGQLGLEPLHDCLGWATGEPCGECYVCRMVVVFQEVRRVLRGNGVCFVEMGDSYASGGRGGGGKYMAERGAAAWKEKHGQTGRKSPPAGLKHKDLSGIPWRLALALQADGWYLRSDIIWARPNPMPESVMDRPTKSHSYVFLLTKSPRYFWDSEAVREAVTGSSHPRGSGINKKAVEPDGRRRYNTSFSQAVTDTVSSRNLRTVWTIPTAAFPGAHFACMPPALVERCIKAGSSERGCCADCGAPWERVVERGEITPDEVDGYQRRYQKASIDLESRGAKRHRDGYQPNHHRTSRTTGWHPSCTHDAATTPCRVWDPFGGAGTTVLVARRLGRVGVYTELSMEYAELARKRLNREQLGAKLGTVKPQAESLGPLFGGAT